MKFERENTKQIDFPSQKQVELSLSHLKGSKRSYASLTSDSGDFIQMAGGGFSCILEKSINGTVYRANQLEKVIHFNEVTSLHTTCGEFEVEPNEYFSIDQIKEAFVRFLSGERDFNNYQWKNLEIKT